MVQPADFGNRRDLAHPGPLDRSRVGCILVEREMSSRPVVVREVRGQHAPEVSLAEDEDVIETLAPDRADKALRERILPRTAGRRKDFRDAHALHTMPEVLAIDPVAIAEKIGWRSVVREGLHDLLGRPVRGGMLGDVEVEDSPAMVNEHEEDEKHSQAALGTVKKSIETRSRTWLARNVRQVWDGGMRRFGSSRETVRSATWMPSFRSSPWILGAPQRGFAAAKRVTKALISALTGGRPPVGRSESLVQCSRKRRRCHRRTVSGATIMRAALHPVHTLDSTPRRAGRRCAASAGPPSSCTRRAAGARRGSRGRAGGGRRRGTGRVEAGGAAC